MYVDPMNTPPLNPTRQALACAALCLAVVFITAGCTTETAATPAPTPTPLVFEEPTELPDQTPPTRVPTVTPPPATSTVVPPTLAPVPVVESAADLYFPPITADVGPFDYPTNGLGLLQDDLEVEALWAYIEFRNAISLMTETGSIDVASYDFLKANNHVTQNLTRELDASISTRVSRRFVLENSALPDLVDVQYEGDQLLIVLCSHEAFETYEQGELIAEGEWTRRDTVSFEAVGLRWQMIGLDRVGIDPEGFVPCDA